MVEMGVRQKKPKLFPAKLVAGGCLLLFTLFLLLQHAQVFLYHDDFGLAVLDYVGTQTGFSGQGFPLSKALAFLKGMYLLWSGRVGGLLAFIYAQKLGLDFVRVLQSGLILLAVLLALGTASEAAEKGAGPFAVFFAVLLYLCLPASVLVGGVYWFAASSLSLWGIPFFLFAVWRLAGCGRLTPAATFCLVFAVTFHEQLAVAGLAWLAAHFLFSAVAGERPVRGDFLRSLPVLVVASAVIFAPGNFNRKTVFADFYHGRGVFEIIVANARVVSDLFFWPRLENIFVLCLLLSLFLLLFYWSGIVTSRHSRYRFLFLFIVPVLFLLLYLHGDRLFFMLALVFASSVALFRVTWTSRKGRIAWGLHVAALASLLPLFYAPGVAGRSGIIFCFLEFVPILYSVILLEGLLVWPFRVGIAIFCLLLASGNVVTIYRGYHSNSAVNRDNIARLRSLSRAQRQHRPESRSVQLHRLPAPRYAEVMPYQRPLIEKWMKKYYQLDPATRFVWINEKSAKEEVPAPDRKY